MLKLHFGKEFKTRRKIFRLELDFDIGSDFRRVVFFGPSGSGKTLAMQSIAGLRKPSYGRIEALNRVFYDSGEKIFVPPQKRRVGYLLQDYALFPHLNILQNVAYPHSGLLPSFISAGESRKAMSILERFGIGHLRRHMPAEISGGQKQRAALARALNSEPDILLLDEPFSALDPLMRAHMRAEIQTLLSEMNLPVVIITHEPDDVEVFAGALVLFQHGHARVITDWPQFRSNYAACGEALEALLEEK
ncbi:MAG: ATP-binding cassette domain-containing protein [Desulfovibrio sp.]|nr:ATP-binding cassette domain-containing protein [Desulfovibrio sp.]